MKKFTADDIVKFRPCWIKEPDGWQRIRNLVANYGGSVDVVDALQCSEISDADAVWLAVRLATPQQSRLAAALFAETVLDAEIDAGRTPDPRSKAAVVVAKRHAIGQATDEELKKACADAWTAYRDVCAAAANAAAAAAAGAEAAADAAGAAGAGAAAVAWTASWKTSRKLFLQAVGS
jgi:hypothetical protein